MLFTFMLLIIALPKQIRMIKRRYILKQNYLRYKPKFYIDLFEAELDKKFEGKMMQLIN